MPSTIPCSEPDPIRCAQIMIGRVCSGEGSGACLAPPGKER